MNMSRIIKDALKYPFSDWKKILILGFVILVSDLTLIFYNISHITNNEILIPFIGFLILFFVVGYEFRIIKSSLNGVDELPKFNAWAVMFKEGIKNYIVHFVYLIPVFLIILFYLGITNFLLDLIRESFNNFTFSNIFKRNHHSYCKCECLYFSFKWLDSAFSYYDLSCHSYPFTIHGNSKYGKK